MRNLTIKRIKSFVGCLVKIKIYIEDASSNDLVINDVPCRKLGELKNNEEKTFEIGEEEAKVFVIADKLSKNYCNEFYQLPQGQEDIYLSGKNRFNLAASNAFRFDNNENEEVLQNRKRNYRKGFIVTCAAIIIGLIVGHTIGSNVFSGPKVKPEVFSDKGMSITLTNKFTKVDMEGFTTCYGSPEVAVLILKEEFSLAEGFGDLSLEDYGNLVIQNSPSSQVNPLTVEGLSGFEYEFTNPDTGDTYIYYSYIYKSHDAFWLIQFSTLTENTDKYSTQFAEWARTVSFE